MVSCIIYIRDYYAVYYFRPIGSRICYFQPKYDDDRIRIADDFIRATEYRIPLLIDLVSEKNPFSQVYSPWPIRVYIIDQMKKLSYVHCSTNPRPVMIRHKQLPQSICFSHYVMNHRHYLVDRNRIDIILCLRRDGETTYYNFGRLYKRWNAHLIGSKFLLIVFFRIRYSMPITFLRCASWCCDDYSTNSKTRDRIQNQRIVTVEPKPQQVELVKASSNSLSSVSTSSTQVGVPPSSAHSHSPSRSIESSINDEFDNENSNNVISNYRSAFAEIRRIQMSHV
ncbi:unnamed protein product [Rotaria socialis]|uniref:Uncharacterized protein n=1 Tax=Rotaria socialis TaxID=392032 RepID=A0A820RSZ1_9BILA|nr:unnamed protein product [Rotaria socialis]